MGKKTPLYQNHLALDAKMVDFAGWDMPLHYGSQVQEHHFVRQKAGVFDVSHMTIVDLQGLDVSHYLRRLVANNIDRLILGKALYTCMLNEQGGVLDDLIIYKMADNFYRLIVNSATHDKDIAWMQQQAQGFDFTLTERTDLAMLAVQGPYAVHKLTMLLNTSKIAELKPFHSFAWDELFIARTGYTGEDGFEIILSAEKASVLWEKLLAADIHPCGLGARDTLRLEAGYNLYGTDMDETVTPLESNLTWTIAWEPKERNFIGREALEQQLKMGVKQTLVGLILIGQGVLRNQQKVIGENQTEGEITSGSFSPTLNKGIALARIPITMGAECKVEIRGKYVSAQIIKPPFVHQSKKNSVVAV